MPQAKSDAPGAMPPSTNGQVGAGAPLVERAQALQRMRLALHAVGQTGGRILLIRGEAGIGKSSLIQHFVSGLDDPRAAATGYCDPLHTPRPLGPVRDLAQHLLGPKPGAPDEDRHFDRLLRHLSRRRRGRQPVHVLVLEDLHWVDQRSLDWLQFVGRRISQLPVLLIGSYRDDEVDAAHPLLAAMATWPPERREHVDLSPLSADGILALGQALVPGRPCDAPALLRITGGNPFYVAELLQHAEAADADIQPTGSVADAVHARLNRLPAPLCALVELASCSPTGSAVQMLRRAPVPEAPAWLEEALRRRLLVRQDDRILFRHELVRMAVQQRMAPAQRRAAHRHLLDALLGSPRTATLLDQVVHHARGAGADDVLLAWAPEAARQAASLGAHREAAAYLASAIDVVDQAPAQVAAAIHEQWAYEAGLSLSIDDQVIAARQRAIALWRQAGRTDKVSENLAGLSRLHWYRGEPAQAQAYIEQAIDALEAEAPSSAKARAWALRAQMCMLQDRMDEAVAWGQQALAFAEQAGDVEMRAHALNTVGSARLFRADAGGEALLRQSLRLSLEHGLHEQAARVYTNLSECLIEMRALDRAEALVGEGIAFDTAHDLDAWTYYLVGRQAQLRFEQDRYAEALAIAEGALVQEGQTLLMRMPARIVRARALLRLGAAGAADALADALAAAEQIGEPQYLVPLRIAQVEAALLSGRHDDARAALAWMEALDDTAVSPRKRGEFLFWRHLLESAARGRSATTPVDTGGLPQPFALSLCGEYRVAADAFDAEHATYLAAWALLAWARSEGERPGGPIQVAADDRLATLRAEAARRHLRRPVSAPTPMPTGHPGDTCKARRTVADPAADGAAARWRNPSPRSARGQYGAARSHPYGLTAKEQQVLALLVAGSGNAAIAETLRRSQRTVENHVSAILSKLGAENRVAVVLRVQSEPWIVTGPADPASSQ